MTTIDRPTKGVEHPNDYYYRPGMELRSGPPRATVSPDWLQMRRRLFSPWITVRDVPDETPMTRMLADHMWQGDEICDALVRLGREIGPATLRDMFEVAVEQGVDAVDDAPQELREYFAAMERVPDWFDAASYERGRLAAIDCTPIGKTGGTIVNVIMTAYGEAVGSATGATGRFQRDPYRRNMETSAFFTKLPMADGLQRDSEAFKTTARVRLMHGQVRAALRAKWGPESYARHGDPISATDMSLGVPAYGAVNLLIDASFGRTVTRRQLDDITMYWSYNAYRFGVAEEVLPRTGMQAIEQFDWILSTYGNPSEWAEILAEGLIAITKETLVGGDSRIGRIVGARLVYPMMLGLVANVGKEPVGYATAMATGVSRRALRVYERAFVVAANVAVRALGRRDGRPDRWERVAAAGVDGDPFGLATHASLVRLAEKHGVTSATYDGHDKSTARDVARR